ncbi:hypothetical protein D3C87_1845370 [compost metagenome]
MGFCFNNVDEKLDGEFLDVRFGSFAICNVARLNVYLTRLDAVRVYFLSLNF